MVLALQSAVILGVLLPPTSPVNAQPIAIAPLTRAEPVDFQKEILPILQKKCLACHSSTERQGELVLETAQMIRKGGDTGAAVVPNKSAESLLLQLASHQEEPFMPPKDNDVAAAPVTSQELGLIKLWIDQGATGNAQNATLSPTQWRPLPSGVNPIYAVAVTPDGQYAACGRANQIFIYHVPTGQLVTRLTDPSLHARSGDPRPGIAHLDLVQSLAFNRDGNMLASGGFRTVKLWRRPGDQFRLKLASAAAKVSAVGVSPDRQTLAVAAENEIMLWKVADGQLIRKLSGHTGTITDLRFTVDGANLVSSSLDQTVLSWSLADGKLAGRLDMPAAVTAIEFVTPTGQGAEAGALLAIGDVDKLVRICKAPSELVPFAETPASPTAVATTSDHQVIAIAGADGRLRIMDQNGAVSREWKVPGAPIAGLAFHPSSTLPPGGTAQPIPLLATAGADGVVRLWNYLTAEPDVAFHGAPVAIQSLTIRPDGKQLASGAADGAISVWNLAVTQRDGEVLPDGDVVAGGFDVQTPVAALSLDGKRLATAGVNPQGPAVIVVDLEAKAVSHTLLGHEGAIQSLAFSPDGKRLVSGASDKSARIWELNADASAEPIEFHGHAGAVTAVAFSANGQQVVSGSADTSLKLWNAADATEIQAFSGHTGAIVGVAFSSANQPVSAAGDKTIRIWNPANGQAVRTISAPQPLSALTITRDFARVAVAGADQVVRIFQLSNGQPLAALEGHAAGVRHVAFSGDGTRIVVTTATDATVWDAATARLLELRPIKDLVAASCSPDVNTLLAVTSDQVRQYPVRFDLAMTGVAKPVTSLTFSPNGQVLYATSTDGTLRGFNATNGQQTFVANHGAPVHDAALSPNGQFLVTAGEDHVIKVWSSGNGSPAAPPTLAGFHAPVRGVTFSADGTRVIGGSAAPDPEVLAFEFATRTLEQGFSGHTGSVQAVMGLEDAGFATLTDAGVFQKWELAIVRKLAAHTQPVTSLAVSPTDPNQLFSASVDGTVRHWNVTTGQQLRQFNHGGPVQSIAVRPDGNRLASAGTNTSVKLWNAQSGQQIADMKGDLRAKTLVTRLSQRQTAATARRDAAKRSFEAAEKDFPVKTAAAKATADALAAATKDATEKMAAVTKAEAAKIAAEKRAIDAAAAAQAATLAKATADREATESAEQVTLAKARAARLATLVQQSPDEADLATAKEEAEKAVVTLTQRAATARAAQAAPAKAVTETAKAVADAAAQVTATQKPYNDAATALRPALATKNTAEQLSVIAARELEEATKLVPMTKQLLAAAETAFVAAQQAVEEAKKAATTTERPLHAVAFSPDGSQLASGGEFPAVHCWDGETGAAIASLVGHQGPIRCLAFVSNDELVSGADDRSAIVWEVNPGWELARTIGDVKDPTQLVNRVLALDFNGDGTQLATGSGEPSRSGEVKIWNVKDGSLQRAILGAHDDTVHGVRFSPDGKVVASCGSDKYLRTFEVASGKLLRRFEGHTHHVLSVSWQGNGQVLASAGAEGVVKIWNAKDGDQTRTIAGFKKQVTSLQFIGNTPDIATASGDPIVRLIRSTNGGTIRNFGGAADFMHSIDITPDATVLVAGGHDSVLRIWNGTNGQVRQTIEPPEPAELDGGELRDE